jgi:hypothetical protein
MRSFSVFGLTGIRSCRGSRRGPRPVRSSLAAGTETALSWASITSRCLEEGPFSLTRASTAGMLHIRNAGIGVRTAQVPCTVEIANP